MSAKQLSRQLEVRRRPVADAWLARYKGSETSFSLGRFERFYLERFPIAVATKDGGDPMAIASLWPTPG
jgi:phosphatidylglycerol lysyltransferase